MYNVMSMTMNNIIYIYIFTHTYISIPRFGTFCGAFPPIVSLCKFHLNPASYHPT